LLLAVALDDVPHGLFSTMTPVIILSFSLNGFSPPPDCGVDLLLDGSLMLRHLPLPAGREITGIWLGKSRRELERSCTCSSKQLILLLNESCGHVADSDGEILRNARRLDAPYTFETSSSPLPSSEGRCIRSSSDYTAGAANNQRASCWCGWNTRHSRKSGDSAYSTVNLHVAARSRPR
jgi:hypothetical protein